MCQPAPTSLNPSPDPVTPFVVLATQRTGSNTLCGYLNGVHGIAMHNELFNDKGVFTHIGKHNLPTTSIYQRDAQPGRFLIDALSIDPLSKVWCPCQAASFLAFISTLAGLRRRTVILNMLPTLSCFVMRYAQLYPRKSLSISRHVQWHL
jgi:hypothetical protein